MFTDFVVNGEPHGDVASALSGVHYDPGLMRPYLDKKGRACVTVNTGKYRYCKDASGKVVTNKATGSPVIEPIFEKQFIAHRMMQGLPCPVMNALLPKDAWIHLDNIIQTALRDRLRAYSDLRNANTYGGFDAMANPILEWERVTDAGKAVVDMDGLSDGFNFNPIYQLQGQPLPITHADFWLSSRFLASSRNRGTPADTIRAEMAGRRVGELVEQTTIGVAEGIAYGDSSDYEIASKVYGYINHPDRITKTNMTAPTGSNGSTVLTQWLACRELLYQNKFYGPYMVYTSTDYDQYLDNLFSTTEPSAGTLRQRLLEIDGVSGIRRLDYLTSSTNPFTLIWVDMSPDSVRAINGMEVTTVQWESQGGMRLNFKVMAIQVPQIRSRIVGVGSTTAKAGILQATTS